MNEAAFERILKKLRGPEWTRPKRADRPKVTGQRPNQSTRAVDPQRDAIAQVAEREVDKPTPFIDDSENLVIPIFCSEKYRWWAGGQTVLETLTELGANDIVLGKYSNP